MVVVVDRRVDHELNALHEPCCAPFKLELHTRSAQCEEQDVAGLDAALCIRPEEPVLRNAGQSSATAQRASPMAIERR